MAYIRLRLRDCNNRRTRYMLGSIFCDRVSIATAQRGCASMYMTYIFGYCIQNRTFFIISFLCFFGFRAFDCGGVSRHQRRPKAAKRAATSRDQRGHTGAAPTRTAARPTDGRQQPEQPTTSRPRRANRERTKPEHTTTGSSTNGDSRTTPTTAEPAANRSEEPTTDDGSDGTGANGRRRKHRRTNRRRRQDRGRPTTTEAKRKQDRREPRPPRQQERETTPATTSQKTAEQTNEKQTGKTTRETPPTQKTSNGGEPEAPPRRTKKTIFANTKQSVCGKRQKHLDPPWITAQRKEQTQEKGTAERRALRPRNPFRESATPRSAAKRRRKKKTNLHFF